MHPERRAAELLAALAPSVWDGGSLPVPVERIADLHFGLLIRESDDLSAVHGAPDGDLSGLLLADRGEIWVNAREARDSPGRRRFTIGHELGHWVLHRSEHGSVFCRSHVIETEPAGPGVADIEEEASLFSAAVLFPDELVRDAYERDGPKLETLCEAFGASRVATERAVFRAVRLSRPGPAVFFWDDDAYDAWRGAHHDGWVVNDDLWEGLQRLHRASCSYLGHPAQPGRPRTRQPKWCAGDERDLLAAFPDAVPCTRCKPQVRPAPRV